MRLRFFKDEQGLLNYLTLTSDNQEIQKEFQQQKLKNYNKLPEIGVGLLILFIINGLYNYFVKSEQNYLANTAVSEVILLQFICWVILKRTRFIKITPIFAVIFLATTGLGVNLALRNVMPFGIEVDLKETKIFQGMI